MATQESITRKRTQANGRNGTPYGAIKKTHETHPLQEIGDSRDNQELQLILEKIYGERGFDFREYRETTLTRRLSRRLTARGLKTYADYARLLDQDPSEYDKIFNDLTINVTSFFRDKVAFKALEEVALPALINQSQKGANTQSQSQRNLRIWSAGCATGEEPYSIAMLLLELLGPKISQWQVAIIATDIDAKALDRARAGVFARKEVEAIPPAWLGKHFVHKDGSFHAHPALRRLVTFEAHNLVSDQTYPYHDLDLLVCRNVFIYFKPTLQTRILKGFYQGVKAGGFLLLGKAEMPLGEIKNLFDCLDLKAKLFRKAGRHAK